MVHTEDHRYGRQTSIDFSRHTTAVGNVVVACEDGPWRQRRLRPGHGARLRDPAPVGVRIDLNLPCPVNLDTRATRIPRSGPLPAAFSFLPFTSNFCLREAFAFSRCRFYCRFSFPFHVAALRLKKPAWYKLCGFKRNRGTGVSPASLGNAAL